MTYAIGIIAGLLFGVSVSLLKYLFLWRPILKGSRPCIGKYVYANMTISMLVNVITLLTVYFLRHIWPYSFEATIVSAALALSLMGKLYPLTDVFAMEKAAKNGDSIKSDLQSPIQESHQESHQE